MKYISNYNFTNFNMINKKNIALCLIGALILAPLVSSDKQSKSKNVNIVSNYYENNIEKKYYLYGPYMHRVELSIDVDVSLYSVEDFETDELYYKLLDENYIIPDYYEISLNEEKVFSNGNYDAIGNKYYYVFYNTEEVFTTIEPNDVQATTNFGEISTGRKTNNYIRVITK